MVLDFRAAKRPKATGATATATPEPWDFSDFDPATDTLTLVTGDVEMPSENGTQYITPAALTVVLSNGDNYVYVELKTITGTPVATLKRAAAKTDVDSSGTLYCKLLWYVDYDESGGTISLEKRYHRGNAEFNGWTGPYT